MAAKPLSSQDHKRVREARAIARTLWGNDVPAIIRTPQRRIVKQRAGRVVFEVIDLLVSKGLRVSEAARLLAGAEGKAWTLRKAYDQELAARRLAARRLALSARRR